MKIIVIVGGAALSLLFGIAVPVHAQHEQDRKKQDRPQQHEEKRAQRPHAPEQRQAQPHRTLATRNQERQDRAHQQRSTDRPTQQAQELGHPRQTQPPAQARQAPSHASQPPRHPSQQGRDEHPQRAQQQQRVEQSAWQQHRSVQWGSDHRTWQQRGGYHGYRIPDDRFRGSFGPEHGFRINGLPFLVVGGYPRFQYGGYWVSTLDPWPEYWGNEWYDNDDVYVSYVDNGYYLFNRRYPRAGVAISISL